MRTVRAFAGEANEFQRYILRIGDPDLSWWPANDASTLRVGVTKALAMAAFIPLALFIFLGAMHGILWYGFILCLEGEITIGKLSAFQGYIFNLGFGIAQVAGDRCVCATHCACDVTCSTCDVTRSMCDMTRQVCDMTHLKPRVRRCASCW